jgi:acetamidase/formamidase
MRVYDLAATPETVHWGYFDRGRSPQLTVRSGDLVRVETVTSHGAEAPELMLDDAVRAIYEHVIERGPGPHILTGPIAIEGAEPGDALEVEVLALEPRMPVGVNVRGDWGLLWEESGGENFATVFQAVPAAGRLRSLFGFPFPRPKPRPGTVLPAGTVARRAVLQGLTIPLRPHLGVAGVAPDVPGRVSTVAPGRFGGNLDQWRFAPGTRMRYPVLVRGALLSCGDAHLAQGDGEITGTGIEAHVTATLRLMVRKGAAPHNPVLETPTHWVLHAFAPDLDEACRFAAIEAVEWLATRGLERNEAYTFLGLACDLGITQVVDEQKGVHVAIPKHILPLEMEEVVTSDASGHLSRAWGDTSSRGSCGR